MPSTGVSPYAQHMELALFFSLMAILFNWIAIRNKFYKLPQDSNDIPLPFIQVLGVFAIYIATAFFLPTTLVLYLKKIFSNPMEKTHLSLYGWAQISSIFFCFFFSGCFLMFLINSLAKRSGKTVAFQKSQA